MLSSNPDIRTRKTNTGLYTASAKHNAIPWKTGTSYAFRDAWSIGIVGQFVIAVWAGNFDGSANPALIGRQAAGPLFFQIADYLQQQNPNMKTHWRNISQLNLKELDVCKTSGDLDLKYCSEIKTDWFIPGVSPFKSNEIFREVAIDTHSGLRACHDFSPNTKKVVYEFWPSDIERVFQRAGIHKPKPPPFKPDCKSQLQVNTKDAPEITSPNPNLTYALQSNRLAEEKIPLSATVASDTGQLYWFVDNQFLGKSNPDKTLMWTPKPGSHTVTVVDDLGRTSHTNVRSALVN